MRRLLALLADRKRRQRGSILSAVLIIVAFLSILVGALMTELTSAFLISRTLVTRTENEATVTSAVELGIHQLQSRALVPPVCATDTPPPSTLTLNGSTAVVTGTCTGIMPDPPVRLALGVFSIDGVHDTSGGRDRYLLSDSSGVLRSYRFGQPTPSWSVNIGGAPTATLLPKVDSRGSVVLLTPAAIAGSGCAGHCVALFNDGGGEAPTFRCIMPASTTVTTTPSVEVIASGSPNFRDYAFFGGSGAAGGLYVYDAAAGGSCAQLASAQLGGAAAGSPLVFPGTVTDNSRNPTISDEIFVLVTNANNTSLQHWRYTEATTDCEGNCDGDNGQRTTSSLSQVGNLSLIGGGAVGYAASSTVPPLSLAVATATGRLELARIGSGPSYKMSLEVSIILPNGDATTRAPYWCHCPGQDLIGVGGNRGFLYLYNSGLNLPPAYTYDTYDVQLGRRTAIDTTPTADAKGDWYFGANDGSVYDVEIPRSGQQMFKAAKFGPGGAIASSPIVAACPGIGGQCLYYASSAASAGSWFARLGSTRIIDLQACISSASDPTKCAANPQLWARVEVGSPAIVGGRGVYVQGWSYYSPSPVP